MNYLSGRILRRSSLAAMAAGLLLLMSPAVNAADTAKAQKDVEAAVRDLVTVYGKNDYEHYFGHMAEDLTIWRGGNPERWTKKQYYDLWKGNIERGGGVSKSDLKDLQIQVSPSGDAAVATYLMPVTSRVPANAPPGPNGVVPTPRDINYIINTTWFRKDGKWVMSHYYWSTPPAPPAGAPAAR